MLNRFFRVLSSIGISGPSDAGRILLGVAASGILLLIIIFLPSCVACCPVWPCAPVSSSSSSAADSSNGGSPVGHLTEVSAPTSVVSVVAHHRNRVASRMEQNVHSIMQQESGKERQNSSMCPKCYVVLGERAKFCSNCGAPTENPNAHALVMIDNDRPPEYEP